MFKLFGKKPAPEPEEKPREEKSPELQAFAAAFLPEEFELLGVTGAGTVGAEKLPGSQLYTAEIGLTAWMEEEGEPVRAPARLMALADEKLLEYLRRRVPRNFILQVRVRPDREDGSRFLMTGLPEPAFDPELKAILEEQKKPVTFDDPAFGQFTLERQANWFQCEADWLGQPIQLVFDREEDREGALAAARTLFERKEEWDRLLRGFAAEQLSGAAHWAGGGRPLTKEQFAARLEAESVQVWADGRLEFWFHDGEMFWTRAVRVEGTLKGGPAAASAEE